MKTFSSALPRKAIASVLVITILAATVIPAPASISVPKSLGSGFLGSFVNEFVALVSSFSIFEERTKTGETQGFRDSTVARLEVDLPDHAVAGQMVQLAALPVRNDGEPVSGVSLEWEIVGQNGPKLDTQNPFFIPEQSGVYKVTVRGAGHEAASTLSVTEPAEARFTSPEKPIASTKENPNPNNLLPLEEWNPGNIEHAQAPGNARGDTPGKPTVNSNFNITAPVLSIPGRAGLNLDLSLIYNSRVWTKMGGTVSFDMDKDLPAPGWSLGYGKVINFIEGGIVQFEGDGTKRFFAQSLKNETNKRIVEGQSNDGQFVKAYTVTNGSMVNGQPCYSSAISYIKYQDGVTVVYGSYDIPTGGCVSSSTPITMLPNQVRDRHGNYIQIHYYDNSTANGRYIDWIKDTVGRTYRFNYSQLGTKFYLTSVTGPGLSDSSGNVVERTFVRLAYKDHLLQYNFGALEPATRENNLKVLASIYYPATQSGFWFGDANSYSPYGMIRRVEEHRGMVYDTVTGTIAPGSVIARRRDYSYPENTSTALSGIPEYSTVSETWDGMPDPNSPAVTQYVVDWSSHPRTTTVISPYQAGKSIEYSFNCSVSDCVTQPGETATTAKSKDGLTFKTEFYDGNNVLRSKDEVVWGSNLLLFSAHNGAGSYTINAVRAQEVSHTEIEGGSELKKRSVFDQFGPYNRVESMRELGYSNETLRKVVTQYEDKNDSLISEWDWYSQPRITSLPSTVEVFDGQNNRIDRTEYRYDVALVQRTLPSVPNWDGAVPCPPVAPCPQEIPMNRGNLSNIIKYGAVTNSTLDRMVIDGRQYDPVGNVFLYNPTSLGVNITFLTYSSTTGYAYPETVEYGARDSSEEVQLHATATYNINTGIPLSLTDVNQKTTSFEHDLNTWELARTVSPTGAYIVSNRDELTSTYTESLYTSAGTLAGKKRRFLNGIGLTIREEEYLETAQARDIWTAVEVEYDSLGRMKRRSKPFRTDENDHGLYWSENTYDAAGRLSKVKAPNGSESFSYYDEASRPDQASPDLGHTFRSKDALGRERWHRTDADGNIVEVVEPRPNGDGSVATNGLVSKYFYDKLGGLTRSDQGGQIRRFRYDSLGRLTHQKIAEAKATLDDAGNPVGEALGQWSDYFEYDAASNVTYSVDARGVRTQYSYKDPSSWRSIDGFARVFSISYDVSNAPGVLPTPTAKFTYKTTGNVRLVNSLYTEQSPGGARIITYDFAYDGFGRTKEKKTTINSRPDFPFFVTYTYDSLSRLTDVQYPHQYNLGAESRKLVHTDFDSAGRTSGLKVDNEDYASNFEFSASGQLKSAKIGSAGSNQVTETYTYNPLSDLLENQKIIKGGSPILDLSYTYQQCSCSSGGIGQVSSVVNNLDRNKDKAYEYDRLGRLTKVIGGANQSWSQSYGYDRYGNRESVSTLGFDSLKAPSAAVSKKGADPSALPIPTKDSLLSDVRKQGPTADPISEGETAPIREDNRQLTTSGTPFDFDGDGKADFSTWRRTGSSTPAGTWVINSSQTGQDSSAQLGAAGNQIAPGDYDGDGVTDMAVWSPTTGVWTIRRSSNGQTVTQAWGLKGDATVPADYDGDGKTDIAVWRPSNGIWYIIKSSDGTYMATQFGTQQHGDIPTPGDYDGDGLADAAVWRPSNGDWYIFIRFSSNGQVIQPHFGLTGDVPVPADYDGDNITDIAVWRPSNSAWYILHSTDGGVEIFALGSEASREVLVPADYDGDGKTDAAVWRPSSGLWTVRQSTTGANVTHSLGTGSDIAVPSAYIRRSSAPNGQSVEIPPDGHQALSFDSSSNRITTSGFEYDVSGNQTRIVKPDGTVLNMLYDASGRLAKIKNAAQETIVTYTYGVGERVAEQQGNETSTSLRYFAWEGGKVAGEYAESSGELAWLKSYIYLDGALLATQEGTGSGETVYFDHPDRLGTRMVTNPFSGSFFEQTTLPFGTPLASESSGEASQRFTTYDRSVSTGLDYAINRFYDSSQGRFTSVDPIKMNAASILNPQTLNLYSYTANDPVNRTDPAGLDWGFPTIGGGPMPTFPGSPVFGGSGYTGWSIPSWFSTSLTNILASLFNGSRDYRGAIVPNLQMNAGRIVPVLAPPLPRAGTVLTLPAGGGGDDWKMTPCEQKMAESWTGEKDTIFSDVTDGDGYDPVTYKSVIFPNGTGATHNHAYNPAADPFRQTKIYAPPGGEILDWGVDSTGIQNFITILYKTYGSQKDVVLQVFHVEGFNGKGEKQADGRILLGHMGPNGSITYGSKTNDKGRIEYEHGYHIHINAMKKWWKGNYIKTGPAKNRTPRFIEQKARKTVPLSVWCDK